MYRHTVIDWGTGMMAMLGYHYIAFYYEVAVPEECGLSLRAWLRTDKSLPIITNQ